MIKFQVMQTFFLCFQKYVPSRYALFCPILTPSNDYHCLIVVVSWLDFTKPNKRCFSWNQIILDSIQKLPKMQEVYQRLDKRAMELIWTARGNLIWRVWFFLNLCFYSSLNLSYNIVCSFPNRNESKSTTATTK